ncbi:TetR/AcrR family transcriptional regulator [Streptomyces daliensis]
MKGMPNKAAEPGLRERKKQATRTALADAAIRLAAEHGAENVTVEAISDAAGVSPRTFFNYFDTHDDAFVMIDAEVGQRVRRALLDAPAELSPLDAVREALAAELVEVEQRHEVWNLRAKVLQKSPHLLVRSLGAHMADELELATAIAQRLRPEGDAAAEEPPEGPEQCMPGAELELYPRLLAAVAGTAVRVSVEHWCAQGTDASFPEIFRRVFAHLASGLPRPPAES